MVRKNFIREKKIYCGKNWLEVDIVRVTNLPEAGKSRKKESSLKQQNLNDKNSKRRFSQIAHANFGDGDYHVSATYKDLYLPDTLEKAEKEIHNYLNRVKRLMKKIAGIELKYMLVTEYTPEDDDMAAVATDVQKTDRLVGDNTNVSDSDTAEVKADNDDKRTKVVRIHHHIIMNGGLSRDEVELLWSRGRINWKRISDPEYLRTVDRIGYINCDRLQLNENGMEALVNYINKRKKGCRKWSASHNLEKPKVRKNDHKYSLKKIRELAQFPEDREVWRKQYPGYEPVKIEFEHNEYTGWSIYLRLRKLRE